MATEAQIRAAVKQNKKKDSITLRPTKEEGREIRQAAEDAGKSLQGYILDAVRQYMDSYINDDRQAAEHTAAEHPTP